MVDDGLLYENGKIKITKNVFWNGRGDHYAIANIKALREERIGKSVLPFLLGLVCLGLAAVPPFFPYGREVLGGAGGLFILLYLIKKENYVIHLNVPQGEVAAFRTSNEADFRTVSQVLRLALSLHHTS